jgi:hypothetical protein
MSTSIAGGPASSLSAADQAGLERALVTLRPPMTTYLAACGWALPSGAAAAASALLEEPRAAFVAGHPERPVAGALERHLMPAMGSLLVLAAAGAEASAIDDVVDRLTELAFHELGLPRCEWRFLAGWDHLRAAAARAGFVEEARLDQACFFAGGYDDLVVAGILAGEWRARR